MIIYYVVRYYPNYQDRYPDEDIGYFLSKARAERVQSTEEADRSQHGKVALIEIEVDEKP